MAPAYGRQQSKGNAAVALVVIACIVSDVIGGGDKEEVAGGRSVAAFCSISAGADNLGIALGADPSDATLSQANAALPQIASAAPAEISAQAQEIAELFDKMVTAVQAGTDPGGRHQR